MDAEAAGLAIPDGIGGMDAEFLDRLVARQRPGARIADIIVVDSLVYGQGDVSTAARAVLDVVYGQGSDPGLPTRLILKFARNFDALGETGIGIVYNNEVRAYQRLLPGLELERPAVLAAHYTPEDERFVLLMEDLTQRGATFRDARSSATLEEMRSLLDQLARLHAAFWRSPRFAAEPELFENHVDSPLADYMRAAIPLMVADEVGREPFKRDLLDDLGVTPAELLAGLRATHLHQASLPQTLLHGDPHIGNTYALPGGRSGLIDWQLSVRGYCMHDVAYSIATALPIDVRRARERELVAWYLDRLAEYGVVDGPDFDTAWTEFRRALVWALTVGWLPVPVANYGWQVNVSNHLRVAAACRDHGVAELIRSML